jgi:riboflavin kinase/FMN adenylyltransferase
LRIYSDIPDIFEKTQNLKQVPANCVATVGFFDGIHCGHKYLIEKLKTNAKQENTKELIITMWEHPAIFFHKNIQLLTTLEEKLTLLSTLKVESLIILNFNAELANKTSKNFIKEFLIEKFKIKKLILGYNNSFGKKDDSQIENTNLIPIIKIDKYISENGDKISSSEIRKLIEQGNIAKANDFLGYKFNLSGIVSKGFGNGHTIGFPTANIANIEKNKIIPGTGVYITETRIENQTKNFPSITNIGYRPTFNGEKITIENHILDFDQNIYNKKITIKLLNKIRNEIKFNLKEELILQLLKDKEDAKIFFNNFQN